MRRADTCFRATAVSWLVHCAALLAGGAFLAAFWYAPPGIPREEVLFFWTVIAVTGAIASNMIGAFLLAAAAAALYGGTANLAFTEEEEIHVLTKRAPGSLARSALCGFASGVIAVAALAVIWVSPLDFGPVDAVYFLNALWFAAALFLIGVFWYLDRFLDEFAPVVYLQATGSLNWAFLFAGLSAPSAFLIMVGVAYEFQFAQAGVAMAFSVVPLVGFVASHRMWRLGFEMRRSHEGLAADFRYDSDKPRHGAHPGARPGPPSRQSGGAEGFAAAFAVASRIERLKQTLASEQASLSHIREQFAEGMISWQRHDALLPLKVEAIAKLERELAELGEKAGGLPGERS